MVLDEGRWERTVKIRMKRWLRKLRGENPRKKQEKTDWFCIVFEVAGIIAN